MICTNPKLSALLLRHSTHPAVKDVVCASVRFKCRRYDRQSFSSLNMPPAMHLTVLVCLFAVAVCSDNNTSSEVKPVTQLTTSAAHLTDLTVTEKHNVTSFAVKTTNSAPQHQTTKHQNTTEVTSEKVSLSPSPSISPQTPNGTEETHLSRPPETATTNQTSNETVSDGSTLPTASGSSHVTATTSLNTTSPALSHDGGKGDLTANPGLVAILCIFFIVIALVLVVAIVKCVRSPRSNFERLEDVPMGKVNEESPFAHYSK